MIRLVRAYPVQPVPRNAFLQSRPLLVNVHRSIKTCKLLSSQVTSIDKLSSKALSQAGLVAVVSSTIGSEGTVEVVSFSFPVVDASEVEVDVVVVVAVVVVEVVVLVDVVVVVVVVVVGAM